MNIESVIEFLGKIPLLQRLPTSYLKIIADVIKVHNYDVGEFVIRRGESNGDVYFVWEGEAEVCGHAMEEIRPEFQFKRFDYFGYFGKGAPTTEQQADVIASSELICLVLPFEHNALLRPKLTWSEDERHESSAHVESILHLDPIEVNLFQGITLPNAPKFGKIFGGQLIGQALAAASKTVNCLQIIHHFQAYFLLVGDHDIPIIYKVHHLLDGKSFSRRRVDAMQNRNVLFTLLASFQSESNGYEHQEAIMPLVPPPDMLLSLQELRERRIIDPRLPRTHRNKVAVTKQQYWPFEIRICEPSTSTTLPKAPPRLSYWFRPNGKLSDEQALHRCVVAYASDFMFSEVISYPHRKSDLHFSLLTLNHTMWFHRTVKADDWLLFVIESPLAHGARGLCTGQMFNRRGELIASLVQEAILKEARTPETALTSKY